MIWFDLKKFHNDLIWTYIWFDLNEHIWISSQPWLGCQNKWSFFPLTTLSLSTLARYLSALLGVALALLLPHPPRLFQRRPRGRGLVLRLHLLEQVLNLVGNKSQTGRGKTGRCWYPVHDAVNEMQNAPVDLFKINRIISRFKLRIQWIQWI